MIFAKMVKKKYGQIMILLINMMKKLTKIRLIDFNLTF
jgi:hypothetical protein